MTREPALLLLLASCILLVGAGLSTEGSALNRLFGWSAAFTMSIAIWCALIFALQHELPARPVHSICYEDGTCASGEHG